MSIPHVGVAIVGTGFSGLGMAIRLAQQGEHDYVVLEKASEVGGTWRDNRYPGCACDVPSRLYSFSFAPNPGWTRDYATSQEIWQYLVDCSERYGVRDRIAFDADLQEASYDDSTGRWRLTAADGRQWTAESLVMGVGALHEPSVPDLEGIDTFAGTTAHTARWPEDLDLTGRRVAVVGTGASAVQLVPAAADVAAHVTVFQRTPAWVLPKADKAWSERRHRLFARYPALQRSVRWGTYLGLESRIVAFNRVPQAMRLFQLVSRRHLEQSVPDPDLRARLMPHFTLGCKRILLSNDYWRAFTRPHVDLVTAPISRVEPDAVVTADGARHEVDTLVLGTGFSPSGSFDRMRITGVGGVELTEAWAEGMRTNLGITVAGFPEMYLLLGPNTGLGHNSVVLMIEFATDYVLRCLARRRQAPAGTSYAVSARAQAAFTREMLQRSRATVWTSGCRSWYLDRFGHNTVLWPGSTVSYWWRTRRVRQGDFTAVPHVSVTTLADRRPTPVS